MDSAPASREPSRSRAVGAAIACAVAGAAVFQFFGNASRGYIDTASLFYWWGWQWFNPASEAEHGSIVLLVSVGLFVRNLRISDLRLPIADVEASQSAIGNWQSAIAMLAALALHAVGFAAQQARLSILALLLFTWGVLRLAGGRRWGAAAMFPLAFLVFAIPVNVLDSVGFWLRMSVVRASAGLAHAAGIGVLRSGTQLMAPDGRYQYDVVAACSGVRSLMALVALAALAGWLSFRTWRRRVVVLLLCAPLVWVGNVARLALIVFAAQAGGQKWGERMHDVMGIGVFAIVLGGLLAAIKAIERWWPESQNSGVPEFRNSGIRAAGNFRATGVAIGVMLFAGAEMLFLHRLATMPPRGGVGVVLAADGVNPVDLPTFLGVQWIGADTPVSAVEREILPKDTGFSRKIYVNHRDTSKPVLLSIVLSGRDRTSIHRPEICLVGQGWTITESEPRRFTAPGDAGGFPATLLHVRREVPSPRGPQVVPQLVAYWFVSADAVVATHWERIARDAWNRVAHARADRWAYVLMQTDAADGEAAALVRMQAVLDGTLPAFQRPAASR